MSSSRRVIKKMDGGVKMEKSEKIITPKSLLLVFLFIVVIPLLPLFISWQWDWWEAWAYALINIFGFALSRLLAGRKHPDLIRERSRYLQHPNPEPWDKSLSPILGLWGALMPITAGLDARFDLSADFSLAIKLLSLIIFLLGFVLSSYALIENRFFSGMVRIQTERDHHVINSGPYRWMRHPGYAGAIINYLMVPFLLDSMWTFVPAILSTITIAIRTALEDQTLQKKLDGYQDYAKQVRYRLFPGIW
jgi:protein-S-isoprenylcysteine O-methyltransferase Ste14